jgi:PAS domain S-box-containing protein
LRNQIAPGLKTAAWIALAVVVFTTALAAWISHLSLLPLTRISHQLDRIARGEFEPATATAAGASLETRGDEFGQVSTKISRIGEQLRGVQEIFSTLRENIEQVMAGMDDGLILFTRDARAVLVSPSVGKFLGVPREALLGRRVSEIFPAGHPLQKALGIQGDLLRPVDSVEAEQPGRGGVSVSRMSVSVHVVADRASSGAMGALVTLRDLDSFERLGTDLATSERLSALGRVTTGVAHEVKNPLNAMSTWLAVLKAKLPSAGDTPPEVREAVGVLESEIHRLDRVVKTFLDFARPVEPDFTELPLQSLLEEVAAVARPQCQRAAVELAVHLPAEPAHVLADHQLLMQALLNLLLNAVEAISGAPASPSRGSGRVEIRLAVAGENAEIRVADNGPGIPHDKQARVFQLFFTTRKGGSGIGLATAYRIVQLHGGSIDFTSLPNQGTSFRIQLPRIPVRGHGEAPVPAGTSRSAGSAAP